jgi:hypothetical protein
MLFRRRPMDEKLSEGPAMDEDDIEEEKEVNQLLERIEEEELLESIEEIQFHIDGKTTSHKTKRRMDPERFMEKRMKRFNEEVQEHFKKAIMHICKFMVLLLRIQPEFTTVDIHYEFDMREYRTLNPNGTTTWSSASPKGSGPEIYFGPDHPTLGVDARGRWLYWHFPSFLTANQHVSHKTSNLH